MNQFIHISKIIRKYLYFKPLLRKIIYDLYDKIWLIQLRIKSLISTKSANWNNIIYLNPKRIRYVIDINNNNWRFLYKFLKPLINPSINEKIYFVKGDWDLEETLKIFNESFKYQSFLDHFIENVEWDKTEFFKFEYEMYFNGNVKKKEYKTIGDLYRRFQFIDILYKKIKKEGYKTQEELIARNGLKINTGRNSNLRRIVDEIAVAIGRNRQIISLDGRHRLIITKMLKLKTIPIKVLIMHPEWKAFIKKRT